MDKLVTIGTFESAFIARLMVAKLKDAGIESVVKNEDIISIKPNFKEQLGGYHLQVMEYDVEDATKILNDVDAVADDGDQE